MFNSWKSFTVKFYCIIIFLLPVEVAIAQNQDAGLWTTLSIEKKITPKFSFGFDQEVRFFNNISQLNLLYSNFGLNYKLNKVIKVSGTYRFLQKTRPDGSYSLRHRFYVDVALKQKFKSFVIVFRSRLQSQVRDVYSSELGSTPEIYSRNKLDLKYDFKKKISPFIAAEMRYLINDPRYLGGNNSFDRIRYIFGFDYAINKLNTWTLYYLMQREFNVDYDPERNYNLGIAYSVSF